LFLLAVILSGVALLLAVLRSGAALGVRPWWSKRRQERIGAMKPRSKRAMVTTLLDREASTPSPLPACHHEIMHSDPDPDPVASNWSKGTKKCRKG